MGHLFVRNAIIGWVFALVIDMAYMRGRHYVYSSGKQIHIVGGANFPMDVFDELVVMRYAELVAEKSAINVEKRAIKNNQGNFGCDALCKKYGKSTAMDMLEKIGKSIIKGDKK